MIRPVKLISVIIPALHQARGKVKSARYILDNFFGTDGTDGTAFDIEIIIAYGSNPSAQRNRAAEKAKGDVLYFLDSDALPGRENFLKIIEYFSSENKVILGGPSLTPAESGFWQRAVTLAFTSSFGGALVKARYSRQPGPGPAHENDLILCNMAIERAFFMDAGMFNEKLYPNEENEFILRAQARGAKLVYHPDFYVSRYQRSWAWPFFRQIFNYGRGRADQFFQQGSISSPDRLVPLGFVVFSAVFPFLKGTSKKAAHLIWLVYILLGLFFTGRGIKEIEDEFRFFAPLSGAHWPGRNAHKKSGPQMWLSFFLFPIMHIAYGTGTGTGIFKNLFNMKKPLPSDIDVQIINHGSGFRG
jgi:cellulose synthase/poly-beta-1,6-N-acetylglucosamine synthase-like glycosyltransferase